MNPKPPKLRSDTLHLGHWAEKFVCSRKKCFVELIVRNKSLNPLLLVSPLSFLCGHSLLSHCFLFWAEVSSAGMDRLRSSVADYCLVRHVLGSMIKYIGTLGLENEFMSHSTWLTAVELSLVLIWSLQSFFRGTGMIIHHWSKKAYCRTVVIYFHYSSFTKTEKLFSWARFI